jgi:hypothetical protein
VVDLVKHMATADKVCVCVCVCACVCAGVCMRVCVRTWCLWGAWHPVAQHSLLGAAAAAALLRADARGRPRTAAPAMPQAAGVLA